jgi:hypothetical protein
MGTLCRVINVHHMFGDLSWQMVEGGEAGGPMDQIAPELFSHMAWGAPRKIYMQLYESLDHVARQIAVAAEH